MSAVLTIENLNIFYQNELILRNINLTVNEHEIICLMGKSGSGKSTFLSALNGFLEEKNGYATGNIFFKGENIKNKDKLWLRRKMSMLFQDAQPFPFSIEKNLTYALEFYGKKISHPKAYLDTLLKQVNLYDELNGDMKLSPDKLSGGQKQRLCIARMLTTEPDILILDEPCSSLDMQNMLIIEDLLKQLAKKYTILMATHNIEQAKRLNGRIITIKNNTFVEASSESD